MMTTYRKFSISLAVSEAAKALGYKLREQQSKVAESFEMFSYPYLQVVGKLCVTQSFLELLIVRGKLQAQAQ